MKKLSLTIIILMVAMQGCILQPDLTDTIKSGKITGTATSSPPPSLATRVLETATPKLLLPTNTSRPTQLPPSATTAPLNKISYVKLMQVSAIPGTNQIQGSAVFVSPIEVHPYYQLSSTQITIRNFEDNLQHRLLSNQDLAMSVSISPDGKWLAYLKQKPSDIVNKNELESLYIVSSDGKEEEIIPWKSEWGILTGWLDNEHLIIRSAFQGDLYGVARWVLNPFTKEIIQLPDNPKDSYGLFSLWHEFGIVSYNLDLTLRVYLSQNSHLLLENLITHQVQDVIPDFLWNTPRWSPTGQDFVVAATLEQWETPTDFFRIFADGTVTRLTDLSQYDYSTINAEYEYYAINYFVWSPDGLKIAFWLLTTNGNLDRANLAVLDMENSNIKIYSLESSFRTEQMLVWSPDSQQLLAGVVQPDHSSVAVVLVDISEGWYVPIEENATPVGWMIHGL